MVFMGHTTGPQNQYHLVEELQSHQQISCKHVVTSKASSKRTVAPQQATLAATDADLDSILDVSADADDIWAMLKRLPRLRARNIGRDLRMQRHR